MEVLVFGGTTEGREVAEWLGARGSCEVVYVAATEYGAGLVQNDNNVTTMSGPLSHLQKTLLVSNHHFACIVDATHPYAQHISASIDELGAEHGLDVVRIARAESHMDAESWTGVPSADDAAHVVARSHGNVLLTTGSKDLHAFVAAMPDFRDRLYVRVLPVSASLEAVTDAGIPARHVVAMQGPFSAQLNCALIREFDIEVMVTKQSGPAGGFDQKVQAARECEIELVVIERPQKTGGVLLEQAQRLLEERYGF